MKVHNCVFFFPGIVYRLCQTMKAVNLFVSWEGIAGCVVHVDVHGECVCCGWMQYSCSRRDVLLFMVTKYPFCQPNALLEKKWTFRLLFIGAYTACTKQKAMKVGGWLQ